MGIPSCSIYTKELITDFGVKKIIRVGSCGAVRMDVKLRDGDRHGRVHRLQS
jgi:purine-nucleoside phosphorylase